MDREGIGAAGMEGVIGEGTRRKEPAGVPAPSQLQTPHGELPPPPVDAAITIPPLDSRRPHRDTAIKVLPAPPLPRPESPG